MKILIVSGISTKVAYPLHISHNVMLGWKGVFSTSGLKRILFPKLKKYLIKRVPKAIIFLDNSPAHPDATTLTSSDKLI